MSDHELEGTEIQLVADEHGMAVFGAPGVVDQFLALEGLVPAGPASPRLGVGRLRGLLTTGSVAAQAGSEVAANSGARSGRVARGGMTRSSSVAQLTCLADRT